VGNMAIDRDDAGVLSADVARRLSQCRKALGLQQDVFASEAGLSQSRYNQYETGKRLLTLDAALLLCARYNVTLDWLFRGDPSGLPYALADKIRSMRAR
jgi:transcriptional regulator with XRE-family HTH domain